MRALCFGRSSLAEDLEPPDGQRLHHVPVPPPPFMLAPPHAWRPGTTTTSRPHYPQECDIYVEGQLAQLQGCLTLDPVTYLDRVDCMWEDYCAQLLTIRQVGGGEGGGAQRMWAQGRWSRARALCFPKACGRGLTCGAAYGATHGAAAAALDEHCSCAAARPLAPQVFLYLDRTHVIASTSVRSLFDMGLALLRRHLMDHAQVRACAHVRASVRACVRCGAYVRASVRA